MDQYMLWGWGGDERGVLQDLITDFFNIEKHDMCPILWRYTCLSVLLGLQDLISDFQLQGKHGLNCYRSQGEGILKGGKKRKDELAKYIYCGLFNVQNLNDGSHYKTGSSGQTQALGR